MFDMIVEMFSYPFMVRAFVVGSLVALCAALLGVSLVLKQYSMIGDGLSHVGFGALAVATAFQAAPLSVAIPVVVLAAVLILRIKGTGKMKGDAAIALISTTSLALGVMVISMTTGMNTDVYNYMFGSILAMSEEDVRLSVVLAGIVLILYFFFYNKIFAVTFDETFAQATGVKANLYNEDDGSPSDLKSDYLSGAYLHACVQDFSNSDPKFCCYFGCMSYCRDRGFLCMGNSGRSQRRDGKCRGSCSLFHSRSGTAQISMP